MPEAQGSKARLQLTSNRPLATPNGPANFSTTVTLGLRFPRSISLT